MKETYPTPQVVRQNPYYASLLLEDYAGDVSELTATLLYSYQDFLLDECYPNFKSMLHEISVTEMRHLELLGKTILLLGEDPQFMMKNHDTGTQIPWTANYVNYEKNLASLLELDISSELMAIKQYEYHLSIIDDPYIQQLLRRIIQDEQQHVIQFGQMLEEVNRKNQGI